jgi:hypothetical protein
VKLWRSILAAIDNAEAVSEAAGPQTLTARFADGAAEADRRMLSQDELAQLLAGEIESRLTAAAAYEVHGRPDEAARLRMEAETVRAYSATGS